MPTFTVHEPPTRKKAKTDQVEGNIYEKVDFAFYQYKQLVADHRAKMAKGRGFTPSEVDELRRIEAAAAMLKDNINAARQAAVKLSAAFR